jgi:gliding motility-associated-like protein
MNRHSLIRQPQKFHLRLTLYISLLLSYAGLCFCTQAQTPVAPRIITQKTIGGSLNETLHTTYGTSDGGFILGGQTSSANGDIQGTRRGLSDAIIIKTNGAGDIEWQVWLGGSRDDVATSVKETPDQGFIVEGYTASTDGNFTANHGGTDIFVTKLSKTGAIEWTVCFGGTLDEKSSEIVVSSEGGYLLTGSTKSYDGDLIGKYPTDADAWIVKITNSGSIQWQRLFNGIYTDICKAAKQLPDRNYILVSNIGNTAGANQREDIFITKLAQNGNVIGQWSYGGSRQDLATSLAITPDGGFVVLGKSNSNNGTLTRNQGNFDVWILKIGASGVLQWQKTFGGTEFEGGTTTESFGNIEPTDDGGYIFTSSTNSKNGDIQMPTTPWTGTQARVWVVKLNCKQEIQWQKVLGGNAGDFGVFVKKLSDENYFITANTASNDGDVTNNKGSQDAWLIKLSPDPKPKPNLAVTGTIPFCEGNAIRLNGDLGPNYNYQWKRDGIDLAGETTTRLTVRTSGKYTVVATPKDCPKPQVDTSVTITVTPKPQLGLPKDTTFCTTPTKLIANQINGATYEWSSGEIVNEITPTNAGKYVLKVSVGGCEVKDSTNVKRSSPPVIALSSQIQECFDASTPYLLSAGTDLSLRYRWSPNNETTNTINITQAGTYQVKVTNTDGCSSEKTVQMILRCVSKIYAPTIFTPNSDGQNDTFSIIAQDVVGYELKIYNRWGELIFVSTSESEIWNGLSKGEKAPEGSYTWQLTYRNANQPDDILTHSGTVMLIR